MTASETASRRSVVATFFATAAAAVSGLFASSAQAQSADSAMVKKTSTDSRPAGGDPPLFSGWVTYGNLVFIAGKGHHEAGDITVHTKSVLDQLEAELKKAGSSMDKVLKVTVFLNDIADYKAMNEVYKGRFGENPPVRTTVAVAKGGVPGDSLVEMDCIAGL